MGKRIVLSRQGSDAVFVFNQQAGPVRRGFDRTRILLSQGFAVHTAGMVGFERVLGEQFPVAVDLEFEPADEPHFGAAMRFKFLRHTTQVIDEAGLTRLVADKYKSRPNLQRKPQQWKVSRVEIHYIVHAGRAAEIAVELVGPAMIGTDYALTIAAALQQARAPMATTIGEGSQLAIRTTHNDGRAAHAFVAKVTAWAVELFLAPDLHAAAVAEVQGDVPTLAQEATQLGHILDAVRQSVQA